MAHSVRAKIGISPVEVLTDHDGNTYDVIASEVYDKLSGELGVSLSYPFTGYAAWQGYKDATPYYLEVTSTGYSSPIIEQTASLVLIKNTGYKYNNSSELGELNDGTLLEIKVDDVVISRLDRDEPILLKDANATIDCNNLSLRTVKSDGTVDTSLDSLAVEFLVTDVSDGLYGLVETILYEMGA